MWIHFTIGIICGVMGIIVFALSYPLYLRNKDFTSLYWFSMWGVWLGILTLIHVIVGVMGHCPDTWIPFSHVQERVGSLILAMWCVFPGQSKETKWLRFKKKFWIFLIFGALFASSILFSSLTSLSVIKQGVINRPQEIIPLCVSCLVLGRLIGVTSAWGKILKLSVLNAGIGIATVEENLNIS